MFLFSMLEDNSRVRSSPSVCTFCLVKFSNKTVVTLLLKVPVLVSVTMSPCLDCQFDSLLPGVVGIMIPHNFLDCTTVNH